MCRAPFSIVFLAVLLGLPLSVPAHKVAAVDRTPSTVAVHNGSSVIEHLDIDRTNKPNTVLTYKENPVLNPIILSGVRDTDRAISKPASNTPANQSPQIDSEWRFIAALLGTMAIICTIAVRRRKSGEPWP